MSTTPANNATALEAYLAEFGEVDESVPQDTTTDPNEGYVSSDETGWVPIPAGMRRVVATFNVPIGLIRHDIATTLDLTFDDADPTVWASQDDYLADWREGLA